MKTNDFFYLLPPELIAQTPLEKRDTSRLLVLNKNSGEVADKHFYDIIDYLKKDDCLILNNTRVLPARLFGVKKETGAVVEFLLLKCVGGNTWECLAGPGKKAKTNSEFTFSPKLTGKVTAVLDNGKRIVEFAPQGEFYSVIDEIGEMPIPPYITKKLDDKERYQTVYSKELGSAAAPTAGLHFTDDLLERIKSKGVRIGYVTLHVGLGTFRPVKVEDISEHKMHSEFYHIPSDTAELINKTKSEGGRVICVGTTSCRTLESAVLEDGTFKECSGDTEIFIYPGYKFKAMDALITNFHLPESTLIMLVSAFAGYENTMSAYRHAVEEKYRFFSFGDAMFITDNTNII